MAYFYGWDHCYITNLDIDTFEEYWLAITCIEAQEILKGFDISAWPSMTKTERKKLREALHKKAYPVSLKEQKQVTNSELAKLLSGG